MATIELMELGTKGMEASAGPRLSKGPATAPESPEEDSFSGTLPTLLTDVPNAPDDYIDIRALLALTAQHVSSSWGQRSYEFASFIFLINLFPNTLLPASILGFISTGSAILGAGAIGQLVDTNERLRFVRTCIVLQKASVGTAYATFLILFLRYRQSAGEGTDGGAVWTLFSLVVVCSSVLNLATIAISVSIERDWATVIADGSSNRLTRINTYLRRIDLISKLAAPLFVSLLTTVVSYSFCVAFLLGYSLVSMIFEFLWINVVYRRLPILEADERVRIVERQRLREAKRINDVNSNLTAAQRLAVRAQRVGPALDQGASDWKEFFYSPVFPSSLAISLLYLSVLSFDGAMLTYLLSHNYTDAFLAGMRGAGVVTGLIGTIVMPYLEKRIGLVRTGTWSIFSELVCLIPVVLSFFIDAPAQGQEGSTTNAALLFTGMAISRIGLWSFDLCQLKILQTTLEKHPRRNSITALQYSLQNMFDLVKYTLTIGLSSPAQFKYAAVVSFSSVALGCLAYLVYVKQTRKHILHTDWRSLLRKKQ